MMIVSFHASFIAVQMKLKYIDVIIGWICILQFFFHVQIKTEWMNNFKFSLSDVHVRFMSLSNSTELSKEISYIAHT